MRFNKRVAAVFVLIAMAFSLAMPAAAMERRTTTVLYGTPSGMGDPIWNNVERLPIDRLKAGITNPALPTADQTFAQILWDANFLYVLFTSNDATHFPNPDPQPQGVNPGTAWDSVEIAIDPLNLGGAYTDDNGIRGIISRANGVIGSGHAISHNRWQAAYAANALALTLEDSPTGYRVFFKFNITQQFPGFTFANGTSFGIDFQINDNADGTSGRDHCFGWNDHENLAANNSMGLDVLGLATLSSNPAAGAAATPTPPAAPPAQAPAAEAAPAAQQPAPQAPAAQQQAPRAPQTFDPIVLIAAVALLSAAGIMIARKRKA